MSQQSQQNHGTVAVLYRDDPRRVTDAAEVVYRGSDLREARRAAAAALGQRTLRGLSQAPTERGTVYYAPGANDNEGSSVEVQS